MCIRDRSGWNEIDLRDKRYNQIIHMVSAAHGAEPFYTLQGHQSRHEGLEAARQTDDITAKVSRQRSYRWEILEKVQPFYALQGHHSRYKGLGEAGSHHSQGQ